MSKILERGDLYFFYRPRLEAATPAGLDDVARFYFVLKPRGRRIYRLLVVGEKRLPSVTRDGNRRSWAFVWRVGREPREIEDELDPDRYVTRTRGERIVPPARPAGEAVYAIVRHDDHTHLAYALELPREPGEVQRVLNIEPEASHVVAVRNPEVPAPPGVGLQADRPAAYPPDLLARFRGRRFAALDPPAFLDHENAEIVLIGAARDVRQELGIELDPEVEDERDADIFRDLRLERTRHPVGPLFEGRWE